MDNIKTSLKKKTSKKKTPSTYICLPECRRCCVLSVFHFPPSLFSPVHHRRHPHRLRRTWSAWRDWWSSLRQNRARETVWVLTTVFFSKVHNKKYSDQNILTASLVYLFFPRDFQSKMWRTWGDVVPVADPIFQQSVSDFPAEHTRVFCLVLLDFFVNFWRSSLLLRKKKIN